MEQGNRDSYKDNASSPAESRAIVLHNMPKAMSSKEFKQLFGKFGKIRDIKLSSLDHTPLVTVQVVYFDLRDSQTAFAHFKGRRVSGRDLSVQFCTNYGGRRWHSLFYKHNRGSLVISRKNWGKIAVSMKNGFSAYKIYRMFKRYGEIRSFDKNDKSHEGMVVIEYYDVRHAQNAMKALHAKKIKGKTLELKFVEPNRKTKAHKCMSNNSVQRFRPANIASNNQRNGSQICQRPMYPRAQHSSLASNPASLYELFGHQEMFPNLFCRFPALVQRELYRAQLGTTEIHATFNERSNAPIVSSPVAASASYGQSENNHRSRYNDFVVPSKSYDIGFDDSRRCSVHGTSSRNQGNSCSRAPALKPEDSEFDPLSPHLATPYGLHLLHTLYEDAFSLLSDGYVVHGMSAYTFERLQTALSVPHLCRPQVYGTPPKLLAVVPRTLRMRYPDAPPVSDEHVGPLGNVASAIAHSHQTPESSNTALVTTSNVEPAFIRTQSSNRQATEYSRTQGIESEIHAEVFGQDTTVIQTSSRRRDCCPTDSTEYMNSEDHDSTKTNNSFMADYNHAETEKYVCKEQSVCSRRKTFAEVVKYSKK